MNKIARLVPLASVAALAAGLGATACLADTTVAATASADTYVNSASASDNFGSLGALQLAAAGANNGAMSAFLRFDVAVAVAQFDAAYGAGGWSLSGVALSLGTNFGTDGVQPNNLRFAAINDGLFEVRWLSDDAWGETTLTYANASGTIASSGASLGVFSFPATGNGISSYDLSLVGAFLSDLTLASLVSLHLLPADTGVSYLFNSRTYNTPANHPKLVLTAAAIPEPAAAGALASLGALGFAAARRRRRRV